MAFDASVIGSIGDTQYDPVDAAAKATTLKDMTNRQQLNQLQLNSAKEEAGDASKVKAILEKSDYTTPQGLASTAAAVNRVSPKAAMDLMKQGQQYQSGQVQAQLDQLSLAEKRQDMIVGTLDGVIAEARNLKNSGGSDLDVNALITQRMPGALQQLRSAKLPDGQPALPDDQLKMVSGQPFNLATLESWEAKSKQGQQQIKTRLEQFKADTQAKGEQSKEKSEAERARHDEAMEANAATKTKQSGGDGSLDGLYAAFAESGVNPPGRSKSSQDSAMRGLRAAHPDLSDAQIAQGVKTGVLKMTSDKTESSVLARREAAILPVEKSITKKGGFMDQAEEAINDVDFSKLKSAGEFEKWRADQRSDPKLSAYKTAVAELRAEYSIVLSKGGQVTDAARNEAHEVVPDLITKDQFKEIKKKILQGIEASKSGVEDSMSGVQEAPPQAHGSELPAGTKYQHSSGATVEIIG